MDVRFELRLSASDIYLCYFKEARARLFEHILMISSIVI